MAEGRNPYTEAANHLDKLAEKLCDQAEEDGDPRWAQASATFALASVACSLCGHLNAIAEALRGASASATKH